MYKEKLQDLFTERFVNDKIDSKRYTALMEKTDQMGEDKIRVFLEQGSLTPTRKSVHSAIGLVASVGTLGTGYLTYRALKALFSECARACGVLGHNSKKRQACLAACKDKVKAAAAKGKVHDPGPTKLI